MALLRGTAAAFALFAAAFLLHIIGGALDQGWLFALAVALIYLFAAGFPVSALAFAGGAHRRDRVALLVTGSAAGVVLTSAALWAANGRSFAIWQPPAAIALVALTSGAGFVTWMWLRGRESLGIEFPRPASGRR